LRLDSRIAQTASDGASQTEELIIMNHRGTVSAIFSGLLCIASFAAVARDDDHDRDRDRDLARTLR
jgi:hypothetical protein